MFPNGPAQNKNKLSFIFSLDIYSFIFSMTCMSSTHAFLPIWKCLDTLNGNFSKLEFELDTNITS